MIDTLIGIAIVFGILLVIDIAREIYCCLMMWKFVKEIDLQRKVKNV